MFFGIVLCDSTRMKSSSMPRGDLLKTYARIVSAEGFTLTEPHIMQLMEIYHLHIGTPKLSFLRNEVKLWFWSEIDCDTFVTTIPAINFGSNARYEVPIIAYNFVIKNILVRNNFKNVQASLMKGKFKCEKVIATGKRHVTATCRNPQHVGHLIDTGFYFMSERFDVELPKNIEPCLRCNQFGHVFLQCRTLFPQCKKCGEFQLTEFCTHSRLTNFHMRKYCSTCSVYDHNTGEIWCPMYPKQNQELYAAIVHVAVDHDIQNSSSRMKRKMQISPKCSSSPTKKRASIEGKGTVAIQSPNCEECETQQQQGNAVLDGEASERESNTSFGYDNSFAHEVPLFEKKNGSNCNVKDVPEVKQSPKEKLSEEQNECTSSSSTTEDSSDLPKQHDECDKREEKSLQDLNKNVDVVPMSRIAKDIKDLFTVVYKRVRKHFEKKRELSIPEVEAYNKMKESFLTAVDHLTCNIINDNVHSELLGIYTLQEVGRDSQMTDKQSESLHETDTEGHTQDKKSSSSTVSDTLCGELLMCTADLQTDIKTNTDLLTNQQSVLHACSQVTCTSETKPLDKANIPAVKDFLDTSIDKEQISNVSENEMRCISTVEERNSPFKVEDSSQEQSNHNVMDEIIESQCSNRSRSNKRSLEHLSCSTNKYVGKDKMLKSEEAGTDESNGQKCSIDKSKKFSGRSKDPNHDVIPSTQVVSDNTSAKPLCSESICSGIQCVEKSSQCDPESLKMRNLQPARETSTTLDSEPNASGSTRRQMEQGAISSGTAKAILYGRKYKRMIDAIISKKLRAWTTSMADFFIDILTENALCINTDDPEQKMKNIMENRFQFLKTDLMKSVESELSGEVSDETDSVPE